MKLFKKYLKPIIRGSAAIKALEEGKVLRHGDGEYYYEDARIVRRSTIDRSARESILYINSFLQTEFEIIEPESLKMPEILSKWQRKDDRNYKRAVMGLDGSETPVFINSRRYYLEDFYETWEPVPENE